MSEQAQAAAAADASEPEAVELPTNPDARFAALMDTLVKDEADKEAGKGEGAAAGTADAAGTAAGSGGAAGQKAAPATGDGAAGAGGDPATPTAGDGAADGAPGSADAALGQAAGGAGADGGAAAGSGGGDQQAAGPDAAAFGELSNAFQDRTLKVHQQQALEKVQTEHKAYFDALNEHPRALVGRSVPAIGKEGNETLGDEADAKSWQEAVKVQLVRQVNGMATKAMDENHDFISTVHASIDLFKNNADLIPGASGFDKDLAERFTSLAEPYEVRVEGKLQGYSVPVQPLVTQLRAQLAKERAGTGSAEAPAAPAAAAESPAAGAPASTQAAPAAAAEPAAAGPQGGIQSKAGQGDQKEDFSVLFGTIDPSLRDMQI